MQHSFFRLLWVTLIASVIIGHTPSYAQQSSRISIDARVGFDNMYTADMWTPVTLTIRGDDQDRTVIVEWLVNDDQGNRVLWQRELSLPAQTTKEIHTNLVISGFARSIVARVQVDNRILASTLIDAQAIQGALSVIVSDDANLLKGLSDTTFFDGTIASIAVVTPNHLPDTATGLQGIHALFIENTAQLTEQQHTAIQLWMELGGRLIVPDVITGNLAKNNSLTLDYATPHVVQMPTDAPAQLPASITLPSVTSTAAIEVHPGTNLLWQRDIGRGTFYQTTLPLNALRDWGGLTWLWRPVLQLDYPDIRTIVGRPNLSIQNDPLGRSLNISALSLPHPIIIFVFMLVYIALVGPVTYIILKRRFTLDWAWVSIPVVAVVVTIMLAITGVVIRGNNTIIYTLAIVQQQAQASQALVSTGTAIYTPFRSSYQVQLANAESIAAIRNSQIMSGLRFQDDRSAQIDINGDIGSVQSIYTHTMVPAPFSVQHQLTASSPALTGTFQLSGGALRDVVVFYGSKAQVIGNVAANQPMTVSINNESSEFPCDIGSDTAQPFDQRRLYETIAGPCFAVTTLPDNRVIIYGWSDAAINPPVVQGARITAQRQLHIITLNLP